MMKGKYLITTDNWFYAPDGKKYRAVWGEVKVLEDNILGVKTNRNSTNWFISIGENGREMIIAGCQIHYAIKRDEMPDINDVLELSYNENGFKEYTRPTEIYIA